MVWVFGRFGRHFFLKCSYVRGPTQDRNKARRWLWGPTLSTGAGSAAMAFVTQNSSTSWNHPESESSLALNWERVPNTGCMMTCSWFAASAPGCGWWSSIVVGLKSHPTEPGVEVVEYTNEREFSMRILVANYCRVLWPNWTDVFCMKELSRFWWSMFNHCMLQERYIFYSPEPG